MPPKGSDLTPGESLPDDILWHQSGVNKAGEPFVQLLQGTTIVGQMSPQEAREHAHAILEAAEASEQDAFLLDFAQNKIGMKFQDAGSILMAFRDYRAKTSGKRGGPTNKRDWVRPDPSQK